MANNLGLVRRCNIYYSTNCHVCKILQGPEKGAKFCSRCKLVQYCSVAHQKQDWPKHKEFCKAISVILSRTKTDHVFREIIGNSNQESWIELRKSLLKLVEITLKRPLLDMETDMIFFPPLCNLSRCYQPNHMFPCKGCNSVLYCSEAHELSDHRHKLECQNLALTYRLDMIAHLHKGVIKLNYEMLNNIRELPSNMESLFHQISHEAQVTLKFRLLSEPLSYFLSVAFLLNKFGTKKSLKLLTFHIVGANPQEILALHTLRYIAHLLPDVKLYRIILIGPEIPNGVQVPQDTPEQFSISVLRDTLYHEYVRSPSYESPDLIVAFNCGFSENSDIPEEDTWKESISCMMNSSTETQILITAFEEKECVNDLYRLCSSSNKKNFKMLIDAQINPFASMHPYRDWESSGVFYVNHYIALVQI